MKMFEQLIARKMQDGGQSETAINAFLFNARRLARGETGMLPEDKIRPVEALHQLADLPPAQAPSAILDRTVVVKLNGGLGTSMGLSKAKSLLVVKDGMTFLDLIARQMLYLRQSGADDLRLLLMNSFATSQDTLDFLKNYPELGAPSEMEFLQSMAPKLDADTLEPATWPEEPDLEWCPPGHGDLYASLEASGHLDALLAMGIDYAFVSNSDNLGATPDPRIPEHMERNGIPFLMEVTRRTPADSKGGHLALHADDGRLVLRESAQCPPSDAQAFQDITRHRYFNTNNLWIRLDRLKEMLSEEGGTLPLPFIRNEKTLDPKRNDSPRVIQIETAMGAAIELFRGSVALVVPRTRFAPVKKTSDLMVLRSDATEVRQDWTLGLVPHRHEIPPDVTLSDHYKLVTDYERLVVTTPSLADCQSLVVAGEVTFREPVTLHGKIVIRSAAPASIPGGNYCDETVTLEAAPPEGE